MTREEMIDLAVRRVIPRERRSDWDWLLYHVPGCLCNDCYSCTYSVEKPIRAEFKRIANETQPPR